MNRIVRISRIKGEQGRLCHPRLRGREASSDEGSPYQTRDHSHSIINEPRKPAWLKGLGLIDMGHYRRFYRQGRPSFAGAGDGALCAGAGFSTPSSISSQDTGEIPNRQPT